ncbi:MAG: exonuclease domain-containing protein [Bacteroidetes bacterium]|nr:exonuclease domain-containing protein [Bacteroidota bacterium]
MQLSEANFIVIDIETTGSKPEIDRIIDIACVTVNNFEITDTYSSFVNPHQSVPWFIQKLTGINNKLLKNAPEPIRVFKNIADLFQSHNTFFVAHAASFDYGFVKHTIKRLNIPFQDIPVLCTLKLAKKVLPSNINKNVSAIAEYFNIPIINRHRAFDDAFATANFFIEILHIIRNRYGINDVYELLEFQNSSTTKTISKKNQKLIDKLMQYKNVVPNQSGVIIFINSQGNVLHISKANSMSEHIDYFVEQFKKSVKNVKEILKFFHRLDWIETTNELDTIITEHRKIKQLKPYFNFMYNMDLVNANDITINDNTQKLLASNFSMIVFIKNSEREKNIDIYFIKQGLYKKSLTIGVKANTQPVIDSIDDIYFSYNDNNEFDADEMKLISNWFSKNEAIAKEIKITNDTNKDELHKNVIDTIRNFYYE